MTLSLRRSEDFDGDFDLQYRWYLEHANATVANRYLDAVWSTLRLLAAQPELGQRRRFRHSAFKNLRPFRAVSPYQLHLIFYRHDAVELSVERVMHGARDLPSRLIEPPGSE
jgi:toxin ParE1/3/4